MIEQRLLPAVCATRANYHAHGYIALYDVHTNRLTSCRIEILTSPREGNTAIFLIDDGGEREVHVIEWADERLAGAAGFVGALRTVERWREIGS